MHQLNRRGSCLECVEDASLWFGCQSIDEACGIGGTTGLKSKVTLTPVKSSLRKAPSTTDKRGLVSGSRPEL